MARRPEVADIARRLPPERHVALLAEIDRIAAAVGCRRGGKIEWEELEHEAGLKRGALAGARNGSRANPDTLVALARRARESPWHLLNPLCGTSYHDALRYLREWAVRTRITPEMLARINRLVLDSEEGRHHLAQALQNLLEAAYPPAPDAEPAPTALPSGPAQSEAPDVAEEQESPDQ